MISKEKIILIILACVNFTHIMDFMIMMPLGPQLMNLFHITPGQFGFAVSSYGFTAGISGFISAFFVDRFDRKQTLLFAYIGFVAGTFACAMAPSYELLIAARILAGLFGGMIGAQVLSIVGDLVPYERRASAMGIVMMAFSLASVIGVPVGLWLATNYNWHTPFWVIGGIGVFVAVLIWRLVPPVVRHLQSKEARSTPMEILTHVTSDPNQLRALATSGLLMLGHFALIPYITPSLVGNVGYALSNIFLIYLVGGGLTIITSPLVGKLADRRGKYPVFLLFATLSFIPIWLITNLWPSPTWFVLAIAGLFFVFTNGRTIPLQAITSSVVPPQQRGGFMAINASVIQLCTALAANVGGWIVYKTEAGRIEQYEWVGYFSIAMIALSAYLGRSIRAYQD